MNYYQQIYVSIPAVALIVSAILLWDSDSIAAEAVRFVVLLAGVLMLVIAMLVGFVWLGGLA